MFKIKFPTKRIFRIFHILRINGMVPFCNLFMERPRNLQMLTRVSHAALEIVRYGPVWHTGTSLVAWKSCRHFFLR